MHLMKYNDSQIHLLKKILNRCPGIIVLTRSSSNAEPNAVVEKKPKGNIFKRKFSEMVLWYEQVTGMDEVKLMQNRVIEVQDKFVACQEKRRKANAELASIQSKLKDIYSELDTTSRGEERYLHLVTHEHVLLKEEKRLMSEFSLRERDERESFALLSASVKESHEKERAQAERTKYWSVIGSIFGTIIGIVGSSISTEFRMNELRLLVSEANPKEDREVRNKDKSRHEEQLAGIVLDLKNLVKLVTDRTYNSDGPMVRRIDKLMHAISNKQVVEVDSELSDSLRKLNQTVEEVKSLLQSAQRLDGQLIAIPADMEAVIKNQKRETKVLLAGMSIMAVVVPVILVYLQKI